MIGSMRTSEHVQCLKFPCPDVHHASYAIPSIDIQLEKITIILISEAAPFQTSDGYYASGKPLFAETTIQAFCDAGAKVSSIADILQLGVYLTTAIKCAKTAYNIQTSTIKECSLLLENELSLFPNLNTYLLMGDVAIKALNTISIRHGFGRVTPAGSTYKIRSQVSTYQGKRVFPSYLQAGPSFFIEKSKRKMIAEDIASALALL
jgi:uracil-DNA glycosylase